MMCGISFLEAIPFGRVLKVVMMIYNMLYNVNTPYRMMWASIKNTLPEYGCDDLKLAAPGRLIQLVKLMLGEGMVTVAITRLVIGAIRCYPVRPFGHNHIYLSL